MPPKKNNVDLICDISELAGLFQRSRSLEDFLQTVVSTVAFHMNAAVCSVYLLDEPAGDLVLTANQGLNPDLVGHLRLKVGEGLTGMSLKELRPIREAVGRRNALFKLIPGLAEERYESFLAVPILRGLNRVGVLVVQDVQQDYFDDNDVKALQAIASQLATTIENAQLLIHLHDTLPKASEPARGGLSFLKGVSASEGVVMGKARVSGRADSYVRLTVEAANKHCTLEDFYEAVRKSEQQLESLEADLGQRLSDVASLIFNAHLLMLKDPGFSDAMAERIRRGQTPPQAVTEVVNHYVELFSRSAHPQLREKAQDVKDLGHRLLQNLVRGEEEVSDYHEEIVISGELLPSDLVKLSAQRPAGLVMVGGGVTAHVSILARSLGVPMVVVQNQDAFLIEEGTQLVLDGDQGTLYVSPDDSVIDHYVELADARRTVMDQADRMREETYTRDGVRITLLANINLLSEVAVGMRCKVEGVGLYRSEFPFIVRNAFPSEEEQERIYRTLIQEMQGRPVTLRTLDIGGDKMLSYFPNVTEANPFLGLRAMRFALRNKDIFVQQVRAMLRAGHESDMRIMFPMVSSVDEFIQARDIVHESIAALNQEGVPHHPNPMLGPMIELPSSVEIVDELAAEGDFLCVGTNDLVQYILGVDRTNEQLADHYVPYHPAVLRSLKRVADAAERQGVSWSVCGDMACDPALMPFLLGIGARILSVDVRMLPKVQADLAALDLADARVRAQHMLSLGRISDLAAYLQPRDTVAATAEAL